jgi:hypothetical protein
MGPTWVPGALSDGNFLGTWFLCLQRPPCAAVKTLAEHSVGYTFMIMMKHYCFTFFPRATLSHVHRGGEMLWFGGAVLCPAFSQQRFHDGSSRRSLGNWWTTSRVVEYFALTHIFIEPLPQYYHRGRAAVAETLVEIR